MFQTYYGQKQEDGELDPVQEPHRDTELTLSSMTLLAIFFGLVLLCGAFFGIGYTVGHRSAPSPAAANAPVTPANTPVVVEQPKPSASTENSVPPPATAPAPDSAAPASAPPALPVASPAPKPAPAVVHPAPPAAVSVPATPKPAAKTPAASVTSKAAPALATSSAIMVQIASVSHQEDADVLVGALRKRGYTVTIQHNLADNMLHVQIGPFPDRTSAYAMRQKLLNDGYNAIVQP
jgi:cell division protein FtsN